MKKAPIFLSFAVIFSIFLTGCQYPQQEPALPPVDLINTAAAQTVEAQQTHIVQTSLAQEQETTPTSTPEPPEDNGTETPTPEPSITPTITETPTPEARCDQAAFVSETIPDGSNFKPGQAFTKTWTLRNDGTCIWNANYNVVFFSGNAMGGSAAVSLTTNPVAPGETVVITMELQAPVATGSQRGDFKLRNANGVLFGIGPNDSTFWVKINVAGLFYNFTEQYCATGVKWTSGAGELPCPGTPGSVNGWAISIPEPVLENGVVDDEPGLQVHPQMINNGWIRGTYLEMTLPDNLFFKSIIGCYGSANCDVKFKLNYRIDGGPEQTLVTWHEVQDGSFNRVKADLSALAGKKVQFVLLVESNGSSADDLALWFGPRLEP